jgi:DNA adenine methylase
MSPVFHVEHASPAAPMAAVIAGDGDDGRGYPGSKEASGVWQRIISQMPAHEHYFELFVGHGAILRKKKPTPGINLGADVDPQVIRWWRRRERRQASPLPTILQECALRILSSHPAMSDPKALVYLDPPYLRETRTRLIYDYEFAKPHQHLHLLNLARECGCMVMVSGYRSELYDVMLATYDGWRRIDYQTMTRGGVRVESLWCNFPPAAVLHDCRWVGSGFRERERIKRKRERWTRRLLAMDDGERQVIREALAGLG